MHAFMIALAISVSVANNHSVVHKPLDPPPGEAQSTIVAPGLKSQCRAGRFLVSNDSLRPPAAGLVTGRDLDHLGGPDTIAKFDDPPGMTAPRSLPQAYRDPNANPKLYPRYAFVTNDHDLVTLSNGDVLYLTGAASRAYVQVPWFSVAYRDQFEFADGGRTAVVGSVHVVQVGLGTVLGEVQLGQ